jgi:hypothetical protein
MRPTGGHGPSPRPPAHCQPATHHQHSPHRPVSIGCTAASSSWLLVPPSSTAPHFQFSSEQVDKAKMELKQLQCSTPRRTHETRCRLRYGTIVLQQRNRNAMDLIGFLQGCTVIPHLMMANNQSCFFLLKTGCCISFVFAAQSSTSPPSPPSVHSQPKQVKKRQEKTKRKGKN